MDMSPSIQSISFSKRLFPDFPILAGPNTIMSTLNRRGPKDITFRVREKGTNKL